MIEDTMFLPENTSLGRLEFIETYFYYDKPVMFSCRNLGGVIYLVVLIDEDDEAEVWVYSPLSKHRFDYVRSGGIDLRTAFADAEDGFVYKVRTFFETEISEVTPVPSRDLTDKQLPKAGKSLNLPTHTLEPLEESLTNIAQQSRREFVRLTLEFPDKSRTEAPATILGNILENVQATLTAIGHTLSDAYKQSQHPSKDLLGQLELSVVRVGAGSFEIEMASNSSTKMFSDSLAGDALERFIELINTETEKDALKATLSPYKTSVAKNYYSLLNSLSKLDETDIYWASPNPERGGSAKLTSSKVFDAISILKEWVEREVKTLTVVGKLTGLDVKTKHFRIQQAKEEYAGKFGDMSVEAWDFANGATINQRYKATVKRTTTTKLASGAVTIKYELISLQPPEE